VIGSRAAGWRRPSRMVAAAVVTVALAVPAPALGRDTVGLVDPTQGLWHLQAEDGGARSFFYGNPGDFPFTGDWNCDGVDTPGLFRQSDGFVYLRNSNTQGTADVRFFLGNPGDVPVVGDFDGDGCDTVSVYRPSEQRFHIVDRLGSGDAGLGAADYTFDFGNPGDVPFTGDFNDDGRDGVGLHRPGTGIVYFKHVVVPNAAGGAADAEFFFGNVGDRFVVGDWNDDGIDSPGVFRPATTTFHLRHTNTQGPADESRSWGFPGWLPVAGSFGLPAGLPPPPRQPTLELVASGLVDPIYVTSPPGDDRLFVVERRGTIRIVSEGAVLPGFFLDLRGGDTFTGGEAGLLSMAFHPNHAGNGRFYVFHSEDLGVGNHSSLVLEFTVSGDPNLADPGSRRQVLAVTQPANNHNGGQIEFGPDGFLYVGLGDGGGANDQFGNGQDTTTLHGSMLRLDVDGAMPYAVPAGNPFVGGPGADEIWAFGLRNPWRWTFDAGLLYIADVGQAAREEINVVSATAAGVNYGWCAWEGTSDHSGFPGCAPVPGADYTFPVLEYATGPTSCAVIGGRVYRGAELPNLAGHYFYGDLCGGWIRSLRVQGGAVVETRDWTPEFGTLPAFRLWSFGSDAAGNVYVVDRAGSIFRIAAAP
jgi:glucose/arabinose dehydrogenase